MMTIQRYDMWTGYECSTGCEVSPDPRGDYVLAEDVNAELLIILNSAKSSMAKTLPHMAEALFDYINDAIEDLGL